MHLVIDKTNGNKLFKGTEQECKKFKRSHFAKSFLIIVKGE